MPSIVSRSHLKRPDDSESDSDSRGPSQLSRDATPYSQASNGSKRIRLGNYTENGEVNTQYGFSTVGNGSGSGLELRRESHGERNRLGTSNPGAYDYRAGAIVRVKVDDFVTYTSAEFFPGPRLNMVIGPNGTGKSTLVCAICLGLGWGPQV